MSDEQFDQLLARIEQLEDRLAEDSHLANRLEAIEAAIAELRPSTEERAADEIADLTVVFKAFSGPSHHAHAYQLEARRRAVLIRQVTDADARVALQMAIYSIRADIAAGRLPQ